MLLTLEPWDLLSPPPEMIFPDTNVAWSLNSFRSLWTATFPRRPSLTILSQITAAPQTFPTTPDSACSPWPSLYWHIYGLVTCLPSLEHKLHMGRNFGFCALLKPWHQKQCPVQKKSLETFVNFFTRIFKNFPVVPIWWKAKRTWGF